MARKKVSKFPKGILGSILIADRYILTTFCYAHFEYRSNPEELTIFDKTVKIERGGTEIDLEPIRYVGADNKNPDGRIVYDGYKRTTFEEAVRKALTRLKEKAPGLGALTIGSCIGLESSLSADREHDPDRYGRIVDNDLHSEWGDTSLYGLALEIFPEEEFSELAKHIYVRADVSLAALGEYYTRIQGNKYHIAPKSHYDKFPDTISAPGRAEFNRHVTLAYVKLSAEVNAGIVYNGELMGGMNHPFINAMRPRPYAFTPEGAAQPVFDGFGSCKRHGACFSGLISESALLKRLGLPFKHWWETPLDIGADHEIWKYMAHYVAELCIALMSTHMPTTIVFGGRLIARDDPVWPPNNVLDEAQKLIRDYLLKDGKATYPDPDLLQLDSEDGFSYLQYEIDRNCAPLGGLIFGAKALCHNTDIEIELPKPKDDQSDSNVNRRIG